MLLSKADWLELRDEGWRDGWGKGKSQDKRHSLPHPPSHLPIATPPAYLLWSVCTGNPSMSRKDTPCQISHKANKICGLLFAFPLLPYPQNAGKLFNNCKNVKAKQHSNGDPRDEMLQGPTLPLKFINWSNLLSRATMHLHVENRI